MDSTDRRLLNILQQGIPLCPQPFKEIGAVLEISEQEVMSRIDDLKKKSVIRRLGGVFDSPAMGMTSTLCAMEVPDEKIDDVADFVNKYDEVTHNYQRDDRLNLWFTVTAHSQPEVDRIMAEISDFAGHSVLSMPVVKRYKIKVAFPLDE